MAAIERAKAQGRPLWRISSTLFYHIASDQVLKPLESFATERTLDQYPPIFAGEQVQAELQHIKLKK